MDGRRVVSGGVLLAAGVLLGCPAASALLAGEPAALPVALVAGLAVLLGAILLRGGMRAPAPRRRHGTSGPARRHAGTHIPHQGAPDAYSWWEPTGHRQDTGGDSGGGSWFGGGDSGGGWSGGGGGDSGGGGGS